MRVLLDNLPDVRLDLVFDGLVKFSKMSMLMFRSAEFTAVLEFPDVDALFQLVHLNNVTLGALLVLLDDKLVDAVTEPLNANVVEVQLVQLLDDDIVEDRQSNFRPYTAQFAELKHDTTFEKAGGSRSLVPL